MIGCHGFSSSNLIGCINFNMCTYHLFSIFEGESCQGQDNFPTLGSTLTMPEPQKEQLESTFQSIGSRSPDKVTDTQEKNASELPQDEIMVSDKEERTCAASMSMDNITSSSKTPLSRYHETIFNKCFSLFLF